MAPRGSLQEEQLIASRQRGIRWIIVASEHQSSLVSTTARAPCQLPTAPCPLLGRRRRVRHRGSDSTLAGEESPYSPPAAASGVPWRSVWNSPIKRRKRKGDPFRRLPFGKSSKERNKNSLSPSCCSPISTLAGERVGFRRCVPLEDAPRHFPRPLGLFRDCDGFHLAPSGARI